MPASWYSTGSSTVMIFCSPASILVNAAYSVVVLPEPVGPVTSKMPCGRASSVARRASVSGSQPMLSTSRRTLARLTTPTTPLSPNTPPPLEAGLDARVWRQAAPGNVQMRQQLDARIDGSAQARRHQFAGMDHPVDAVAHMQAIVERLQVDVGSAQIDDPANDGVDQADDRRLAGQIFQMLDEIAAIEAIAEAVVLGLLHV